LQEFQLHGALTAAKRGFLINDLEAPAFICSPNLLKIKGDIQNAGIPYKGVMMSGSGTSIYGIVAEEDNNSDTQSSNVVNLHKGLQFFNCKFLSKKDTVHDWY
jgi:4-diphosphocytidyl-2C-methyl-D-erythritol kinase